MIGLGSRPISILGIPDWMRFEFRLKPYPLQVPVKGEINVKCTESPKALQGWTKVPNDLFKMVSYLADYISAAK
jgi:hypothetical protein